ncbi:nSTAND1 domain-containing NTPase [Streptomyces sp. NPDC001450]
MGRFTRATQTCPAAPGPGRGPDAGCNGAGRTGEPRRVARAVVKPDQRAGLIVERALTTRLPDEVEADPGVLPLLSHVLVAT